MSNALVHALREFTDNLQTVLEKPDAEIEIHHFYASWMEFLQVKLLEKPLGHFLSQDAHYLLNILMTGEIHKAMSTGVSLVEATKAALERVKVFVDDVTEKAGRVHFDG